MVSERLEVGSGNFSKIACFPETTGDWPTYRANNTGAATTETVVSADNRRLWWITPDTPFRPTAPVTAGGLVFLSGSDGIVRSLDARTGMMKWKAYTGGAVRYPPTVWNGRAFVGSGDGWVYAFEAATGRLLWRFNAAPANRKIPVYDSLMSTWPVATEVLVEDGVAYFAAGIANYDGTHVYALDAKTGQIVWQNNTSGHLDPDARTGVSVQGDLLISNGKLYLAGGTSVSPAVYDLRDGRCLNDPAPLKLCASASIRGRELYKVGNKVVPGGQPFYGDPSYPAYDLTISRKMLHTSAHGRDIVWLDNNKLMCFRKIDTRVLDSSVAERPKQPSGQVPLWGKLAVESRPLWQYECDGSVAFARGKNAVLFAGARPLGAVTITAVDINSGKNFWKRPAVLESQLVPWGMAVDRDGRVVVTLIDGQLMCFGPPS